jgi:hypothetical protein
VVSDVIVPAPAGGFQHADPGACLPAADERCQRCDGLISPIIVHTCPDGVIPVTGDTMPAGGGPPA